MLYVLLAHPALEKADVSSLANIVYGAAPMHRPGGPGRTRRSHTEARIAEGSRHAVAVWCRETGVIAGELPGFHPGISA